MTMTKMTAQGAKVHGVKTARIAAENGSKSIGNIWWQRNNVVPLHWQKG